MLSKYCENLTNFSLFFLYIELLKYILRFGIISNTLFNFQLTEFLLCLFLYRRVEKYDENRHYYFLEFTLWNFPTHTRTRFMIVDSAGYHYVCTYLSKLPSDNFKDMMK